MKITYKSINFLYIITVGLIIFGIFNLYLYQKNKTKEESIKVIVSEIKSQTPSKKIYLTFDMDMDGHMHKRLSKDKSLRWYDPELISYLVKNNIQATFFISGLFAETYPELLKSLALNPNFSFQNHAYDETAFVPHCYWLSTLKGDKEKTDQITKTQDVIQKTTGQTPEYFRYPGICHDQKNDTLVQNMGFKISNGSINPSDPFNKNKDKMVKIVMKEAKDGGVVVMHVGGPNAPKSLEVLKEIVPGLVSKDFAFTKL